MSKTKAKEFACNVCQIVYKWHGSSSQIQHEATSRHKLMFQQSAMNQRLESIVVALENQNRSMHQGFQRIEQKLADTSDTRSNSRSTSKGRLLQESFFNFQDMNANNDPREESKEPIITAASSQYTIAPQLIPTNAVKQDKNALVQDWKYALTALFTSTATKNAYKQQLDNFHGWWKKHKGQSKEVQQHHIDSYLSDRFVTATDVGSDNTK